MLFTILKIAGWILVIDAVLCGHGLIKMAPNHPKKGYINWAVIPCDTALGLYMILGASKGGNSAWLLIACIFAGIVHAIGVRLLSGNAAKYTSYSDDEGDDE